MKKLLILTLAVASLGLLAEQTINLNDHPEEIIGINESDTYIITGTGDGDTSIAVDTDGASATLVLSGCTMENGCPIMIDSGNIEIQIVGDVNIKGEIDINGSSAVTVTGTGCLNLTKYAYFTVDSSSTLTIDGPHIVCGNSSLSTKCLIEDLGDPSSAVINFDNATIDILGFDCIVSARGGSHNHIHFNGGSIYNPNSKPFVVTNHPGGTPNPVNTDGNNVYIATLPDACTENGSYEYAATAKGSATPYTTYVGPGHSDTDDLFLPLPDGTYTIAGTNGKSYVGEINGGSPAPFTPAPEPCCGLLALLAGLGLLRRK